MPPSDASDAQQLSQWLAAAALRDARAFQRLYQATAPKLFGFALRILGKRELAEEAVQDAYVAIWHAAGSYQAQLAAPLTWMAAIVRNKALDILRRSDDAVELDAPQFDSEILNAMQDPQRTPIERLQLSGEARALAHCMSALEGLHRQAIGLAYFHDLSHSEIAAQLSLPIGTVKTWIRRGLEKLKTCLGQRRDA